MRAGRWVDDNPGCCDSGAELRDALQDWWVELDDEQQQVLAAADRWRDDHGLEPTAGQSRQELILETASERWDALGPADRQAWLAGRRPSARPVVTTIR